MIVVVVITVSAGGGGGSSPMPVAELTAAGCTPFTGVAPTAWDHVFEDETPADYKFGTFPRTADIHDPTLVIWNRYTDPVSQMMLGHNLEHGGMYVQYGDGVSSETVQEIADWWASDPNAIVIAPFPELEPDVIALGAWSTPDQDNGAASDRVYESSLGQLAYCNAFDETAFSAFRDAFRGLGPEPFPVNLLEPGT